jgi:prepilin-type N-terminal cleavage/methylation domain-containing protein
MRRGFTLLELSIVLVLIALVLGGGLVTLNGYLQASQFNVTVARLDAIEKALLDYSVANGRIPCPSDLGLTSASTNYGVEAAMPGTCTGGAPVATFIAASGTAEGGVPTRTLKLSDDYMYDGWGRKIRYAVDPTYTSTSTSPLPVAQSCSLSPTPNTSAITVKDAGGAARTTTGAYALVSHGANGHGAYTSNAVMVNASSTNAGEQTNCHCNSSAVSNASYVPTYVQMAPKTDPASTLDNFDDIVTYKDAWQLQKQNAPVTLATCPYVYVADPHNDRIVKLDLNGNYVSQLTCSGTGACADTHANGQFYPNGVAIDSNGNFWVSDSDANRVEMLDSNGNYLMQIGSCSSGWCNSGTAAGSFSWPTYITIDSNGYLWITDMNNYRVQKFTSAGAYAGVTVGTGTSSAAAGSFKQPGRAAVDASGNIYVPDAQNNNVQIFNSSGTYTGQLGGCGSGACTHSSANAKYYGPTSVVIDSGGNFWITEYFNSRVQKLNSSGTWQLQLGCTSGGCGWGTGPGQFDQSPQDAAIDSYGHVWVPQFLTAGAIVEFKTDGSWVGTYSGAGSVSWGYPDAAAIGYTSR